MNSRSPASDEPDRRRMKSRDSRTARSGASPSSSSRTRAAPEDAADHRGRLQRRLLDGRQQVDACRQHRVDRVGHQVRIADVAGAGTELLQEERVALGAPHDLAAELAVEVALVERDEERVRLVVGERLEPQRRRASLPSPRRPCFEQVGAGRRDHEQRLRHLVHDALDQIEQRLVRPVQVFEEEDDGAVGGHPREQLDPGGVQVLARRERVEVARHVEAECQAQDLLAGEPPQDTVRRVGLQQPQLLAEHVRERAVGRAASGREAPARPPQRLRGLGGEACPELLHEA